MVGVLRTNVGKNDVMVLVDEQGKFCDYFTIKEFTADRYVVIEDKAGRSFTEGHGFPMQVHPKVTIQFPRQNLAKSSKRGYLYTVFFHVYDRYRVHYLDFLKDNHPEVFKQLPLNVQQGV